jgi:hypothetical protein
MDKKTRAWFDDLHGGDNAARGRAYEALIQATEKPVDWAYEAWAEVLADLTHKEGHNRAIAGQLFSHLAKSDPENRMLKDFKALLNVTRDEKFVTARHTMQNIWKVGLVGAKHQKLVVDGLALRFKECATEKNGKLTRYDIQVALRHLYDAVKDEKIKKKALALIETETDEKQKKKYTTAWRGA